MKRTLVSLAALLLVSLAGQAVAAGEAQPLHQQIDHWILAGAGDAQPAGRSGDAEFLRRLYLDLGGRIPTRDEAVAFLDDDSADKRTRLIDQLLASDLYPRRMTEAFHVMLMERRGDNPEWEQFLLDAFQKNRPWDEMARDLLRPDAENETTRGSAYFYTARLISEGAMADVDVPGLTRDVARLLAGKDLQCAQCHDHISIDDYKQRDFQGLHTIFLNIKQQRLAFPAISEGVMTKKQEYMSVFIQTPEATGPVIPGGKELEILTFEKGEEYLVPPDKKTKTAGIPKFSPLGELAQQFAQAENREFTRNIANRLWFLMMGRGIVHPLDVHHSNNPPSHPELLDALAKEFAAHRFDIKWMLREIALSDAYQRTSVIAADAKPPAPERFLLAIEKRISAEQLLWSTLTATGELARLTPPESPAGAESAGAADQEQTQPAADPTAAAAHKAAKAELDKLRKQFVKMYANPPRVAEEEFEPSVAGALFTLNSEPVLELLQPREGNLLARLAAMNDEQAVEEAFLALLSHRPSDEDRQDLLAFLADQKENRPQALTELVWALWASNEFFINH